MTAATLPYLTSISSIKTAFEKIKAAATPERITGDFINTKLLLKGGTGAAMLPFLKRIGLVNSDGSPTELYRLFRARATAGGAIAKAIKHGYKPLSDANEYFYDLNDQDLLDLILQVTGAAKDSQVPKLTLSTLKTLKQYAEFDEQSSADDAAITPVSEQRNETLPSTMAQLPGNGLGLNLSYTINLNLPATSDQAVFNAIFRSLKEHLLNDE